MHVVILLKSIDFLKLIGLIYGRGCIAVRLGGSNEVK